jgi:hypothetical protein
LQNIKQSIEKAISRNEADKVQRLTMDYQTASILCGELAGALSEAERYQTFADRDVDRGGFEHAAALAQSQGEEKKPIVWHYGGMIEYVWNVWKQTKSKQADIQMRELIGKMGAAAYEMGALLGSYKENVSYIVKYDEMVQANGGLK